MGISVEQRASGEDEVKGILDFGKMSKSFGNFGKVTFNQMESSTSKKICVTFIGPGKDLLVITITMLTYAPIII